MYTIYKFRLDMLNLTINIDYNLSKSSQSPSASLSLAIMCVYFVFKICSNELYKSGLLIIAAGWKNDPS